MTRPDLSFAAHNVAKFSDNPGPAQWKTVMKVMQYLRLISDCGIVYGGKFRNDTKLPAWIDADHATCLDTRRSVSGEAFMLVGGAISRFFWAQKLTAAATSKSKYIALGEANNELRFLRQEKYFIEPPTDAGIPLHKNNQGAITMANSFSSRRTRHIDVKHHVVRDVVDSGIIRVKYVKSGEQHADILSKAL
ncbi:unnamed protein product, partial [Sphacelaria rigidula]